MLAFLGSGIISFQNALGIVFGANLGTTITAWIVATFGFKVKISDLSYPFLAIGILSYLMLDNRQVLKNLGSFLIGFGLLFLGLDFMKVAIEKVAEQIDLGLLADFGLWMFLLVGTIFTVLIQSSSAMIVIVLSALNADLVTITQSVALIIGANIGTSSTLVLASIKGSADKKRLAASNVIFNLVAGLICFLLIHQLVNFTLNYLGIKEPLMELVFLNTIINLIGIILFFPFIPAFARFMNQRFKTSEPTGNSLFIKNVTPEVSDLALKALENEISRVYNLVESFILSCLLIDKNEHQKKKTGLKSIFRSEINHLETYNQLKSIEDEITEYYTQIQQYNLSETESNLTASYMIRLRLMIISAKSIKDVINNIKQMEQSEDKVAREILKRLQDFANQILNRLNTSNLDKIEPVNIIDLQNEYEKFYTSNIEFLYTSIVNNSPKGVSISTITNAIKKTISSLEELTASFANAELRVKQHHDLLDNMIDKIQ